MWPMGHLYLLSVCITINQTICTLFLITSSHYISAFSLHFKTGVDFGKESLSD